MIALKRLQVATALAAIIAATLSVFPALAQVSDEQRSAIRASCRSDFMSNCSGVQPGGAAALQCLQQNMAKLSGACKSAVSAITPQETSKESPKAATVPAPKAEALQKSEPPKAETSKTESAPKTETAPPPAAAKPAAPAPKAATAKPSPASPAKSATATAAPPPPPPPPPLVLRPLRPLEELRVLRTACGGDAQTLCSNVPPGGGRVLQCLASQPAALSPACKEVLGQFAAQ